MTIKKKLVFSALGVSLLATGGALVEDNGLLTTKAQKVLASEVGQRQVENGQMLEYVNNRRAEENAKISNGGTSDVNGTRYAQKLEYSQDLENFANWKARDMAENQYFAHTTPDGTEVVGQYHNMFGDDTKLRYSGENIYVSNINLTKEEFERWAFDAWHESKPHDTGMVREYNTHLGFGYYLDDKTGYTYGVHTFGHDPNSYQRNDSANGGVDPSEDMKQWYSSKQVKEGLEQSYRPGSDGKYHSFGKGGDPAQYKAVDQEQYRNGSYLNNEVETPVKEDEKDIWDNTGESKEPEEKDYEGGVVGDDEDETVEIPPTIPTEPNEPSEPVEEDKGVETPVEEDKEEEPTTPVEPTTPTVPSEPVEDDSKDETKEESDSESDSELGTDTGKEDELEDAIKDEEKDGEVDSETKEENSEEGTNRTDNTTEDEKVEDSTKEDVDLEVEADDDKDGVNSEVGKEDNTETEESGEVITPEGKEDIEGEEDKTDDSEDSESVENDSDDLGQDSTNVDKESDKGLENDLKTDLETETEETTEEKEGVVVGKETNVDAKEVKKDGKEEGTKFIKEKEDAEGEVSDEVEGELPKTGVSSEEGMKGSLLGLVLTTIGLGFLVRKYRRDGQEEL